MRADADLKPFGWAPGNYTIACLDCGLNTGPCGPGADKRSIRCRACATKAADAKDAQASKAADWIVREVAELGDRTSPDDWPEAMLVTGEELHTIVMQALTERT